MHVSLSPELEKIVESKVESGLYDDASEVIREALRLMQTNEHLIAQLKLESLRRVLAEGEQDLQAGRYRVIGQYDLGSFMQSLKERVRARTTQEHD
jgi:antitoxin ParD1/3/4